MVRLTDRPDMTLDVYRGRKTTIQQQFKNCILQSYFPQMLQFWYAAMSSGTLPILFRMVLLQEVLGLQVKYT